MQLSERHVQAIWYDRRWRPLRLCARDGVPVRVVHPGEWNGSAGPDFRNAVLEIGDPPRRLCGDVEVHLSPLEWETHGHGDDPAYRHVVAHVTWASGPEPPSLPSGAISIWLGRFVQADPAFTPAAIDLEIYPFGALPIAERPCRHAVGEVPDLAERTLAEYGRRRLQRKARRFAERLSGSPQARRQIFYEEVMGALGYCENAAAFRRVAAAVPLRYLEEEPENFGSALISAADFSDWFRCGQRPANRPRTRLATAAEWLNASSVMSLADARDFSADACRRMLKDLCVGHLVGKGRSAAVLANVVVPFALAEGRLATPPEWLPPEDVSRPVRMVARRMFGRDHHPPAWYGGNDLKIQGLLEIYREGCLKYHPECRGCRLAADGYGR